MYPELAAISLGKIVAMPADVPITLPAGFVPRAIVVDLDGTTIDYRQQLHPRIRAAVRAAARRMPVIIATGRMYRSTLPWAEELGVREPLVCYQGAMVRAMPSPGGAAGEQIFEQALRLRPGDPVYYDILHSYMGYRTCYYRCFSIGYASHALVDAYKRCRDYLDAAISLIQPGRQTSEIAAVWPKAQEFGFPNEEACFGLQYGHGIGLADRRSFAGVGPRLGGGAAIPG